jgi:hypothetical protein
MATCRNTLLGPSSTRCEILCNGRIFLVRTTEAKDIVTLEQTLRDAGEEARGIILMPCYPTDQVLGLQIKSDKPQSGMNAYTWKLLTAVVRLHLTKYKPSAVKGHSDCMSAIIQLNNVIPNRASKRVY